jgi:hypothetical protein
MTCQLYNPAPRRTARQGDLSRRGCRRFAAATAVALALALLVRPSAAQIVDESVAGPPVVAPCGPTFCPPPVCAPRPFWVGPAFVGQPTVQIDPAWPPAMGGAQPTTTFYPPASVEDAAPLFAEMPGVVRVIVAEAFLNRLLARNETDAGPVVDRILGADVTGSQNTNTTLSVDVLACGQMARWQFELTGTTQNQTIGVTPQAAVRSRGTHEFRVTKQVDFDGLQFSTRSPAAWVTPRLSNEGAATPLTGVPLLGPLSNQIALSEAERRRPAAEQVITRRVTDQVAPRFNQEVDQQLSNANVRLQEQIPYVLGLAGLTPADVSFSSTDAHVLFGLRVPQLQTNLRPVPEVAPPHEAGTQAAEPAALEPPPAEEQSSDPPPAEPELEPTGTYQSNRLPVLLAPIEVDDAPAAAEPAPADPQPAESRSEGEADYTVIRQISDVPSAPTTEPSLQRPSGSPTLPLLEIEPQPTPSAPSNTKPLIVPPTEGPLAGRINAPPSFTAGSSVTVAIHEAAINYALQRAPLGGVRVPDRTIDRLLKNLTELLAGTSPAQLSLEGLGDEEPEFAAIVLRQEAPLSVRFIEGQVLIEAVAAFEPLITPAVPAQRVRIAFTLEPGEAGRLLLVPGEVTVEALPGEDGGALAEVARPIIRLQVMQRLKTIQIPTSLPLNLPGLPAIELTTREALLADGWLLIAID